MMRPKYKLLLVVAVLAGTIAVGASQADAHGWRGWYGPVGWGYWDGGWAGCYDCGGYWGVRPWRVAYRPYRWYRGWGWDCCGWNCGCCGWDFCCTGVVGAVGCCADGGVVAPAAAAPPAAPAPAPSKPTVAPPNPGFVPAPSTTPTTPPSLPPSTSILRDGSGLLTIWVPEDAKVFVNGYETKSTGAQRRYVSHGLKGGLTYKYEVRAQVVRDGKTLEEVRNVYLTSGAREGIAINFDATKNTAKDLAVAF